MFSDTPFCRFSCGKMAWGDVCCQPSTTANVSRIHIHHHISTLPISSFPFRCNVLAWLLILALPFRQGCG